MLDKLYEKVNLQNLLNKSGNRNRGKLEIERTTEIQPWEYKM